VFDVTDAVADSASGGARDPASLDTADLLTRNQHLDLDQQLGRSVWLAHADGEQVTARAATAAVFDDQTFSRDTATEETARYVALSSPHLVPVLGVADRHDSTWLVSAYVEGVSLARLMCAATLTPVQAAYLAEGVLRGLAQLHRNGVAHGRLTSANVQVGTDGVPRLTDWALSGLAHSRGLDRARADDVEGARTLLAELAANADLPAVHHQGTYVGLLTALADPDPAEDAATLAARMWLAVLAAVGDETSMAVPRSEICRLVTVLVRRSTPDGDDQDRPRRPEPIRVPTLLPSRLLPHADPLSGATRRRLRHRGVAAALVGVLLVGGCLFGRAPAERILGWGGSAPNHASPPDEDAGTAGRRSDTPARDESATRRVPSFGPPQAGDITAVELRALGPCTAPGTCTMQITVRITSTGEYLEVSARLAVVNRCTGAVRTLPAGTVNTQPGWTSAFLTTSVALPDSAAVGVVAVTVAPARAASPPLRITADRGSC